MRGALALAAVAVLAAAPASRAGVEIKGVDGSSHPHVTLSVVSSSPTSRAPTLRENGERVRDVDARNLARGKSLVVAVDRSKSMEGQAIVDARSAVRRFVATKPPSDRLAVLAFGSKAVQLSRFSGATIDADIALRSIEVDKTQGTALYDTIVLGSRALARETSLGRVLVVLTDGADVSSEASPKDAIAAARSAKVAVYPIGIESGQFSPGAMHAIAQGTGGRYFAATSSSALADVYQALAAELERTWRLEYVTSSRPGDRVTLSVNMRGAGSASAPYLVPGSAEPPKASTLVPAFLYESAVGTLALAGIVGLLALGVLLLIAAARRGSWLRNRLEPHVKSYAGAPGPSASTERLALASELFLATERSFGHLRPWKALERLIERADVPLKAVQIVYISVGAALVCGLVAAVLALPTMFILGTMALAAAAPTAFVFRKGRKRTKAFDSQLGDILQTMAASLKAGHSFKQGIQTVVDDGEPPASKEFQRVVTEIQLGRPMDEALADMAQRVGSQNFDFVMTAVTIQRQVGGSLANLFDSVAQTVRDRHQFARKIKSLTAMGRGSAYLLIALPFVLAGMLTLLNSEYMAPLFTDPTGHVMIGIGLVMITIGSAILWKIVSFKG